MKRLMDGNQRYVAQKSTHPNQTAGRRIELAKGQEPFAAVIGCSDSRVPPEIIFDQGLGDLFVIRVAGNILDDVVIGSVEYAIEHLSLQLIVVLGHSKCGAVAAAIEGGQSSDHTISLIEAISPAVEKAKSLSGDVLTNAIKANVEMVVAKLKSSEPILAERVKEGKLEIIGAFYDLGTGKVSEFQ